MENDAQTLRFTVFRNWNNAFLISLSAFFVMLLSHTGARKTLSVNFKWRFLLSVKHISDDVFKFRQTVSSVNDPDREEIFTITSFANVQWMSSRSSVNIKLKETNDPAEVMYILYTIWRLCSIYTFRVVWIRIRMSAGSLSKCFGFINLSASVISPSVVKIGRRLYEKC